MRQLEQQLHYQFQQEALLDQALTHPSVRDGRDNQRLEFLGDAVLEFCMSDYLYHKYSNAQEGELTARRAALVCEETLYLIAKKIELGRFLHMGHGEQLQNGREKPSILADAMEAVFAAVYLDGGMEAVQKVILNLFQDEEAIVAERGRDEKGFLQEHTQACGMSLPEYEIIEEKGPDHCKEFVAQVSVMGQIVALGRGPSKKAAEQAAARHALAEMQQQGQKM